MISEPFENFHKEIWNLTRKLLNLKFLKTFCEKSLSEFKDSLISDMKKLNDIKFVKTNVTFIRV